MKRLILIGFGLALTLTRGSARIGETPAQLEARFGKPLKQAVEPNGTGLRIYHSDEFTEIRVLFLNGTSEKEEYKYAGEPPIPPALVDAIRKENPGKEVFDATSLVIVYSKRGLATEDRLPNRDQLEHRYSGQVKIKKDGDWQRAILRDQEKVVEIPILPPGYPQELTLTDGASYSVAVLDQDSADLNAVVAVISRREHADWHDCVNDAGVGGIQQLVRISSGDKVVYDRSVCGLHHVKMELRKVQVAYGMIGPKNWAESYCIGHFPHFRDFALGGCVVGDAESASIYICPKCVAECDDYARQHQKDEEYKEN